MLKFFNGLFYFYLVLLWILGGLLHLWTVYIAYSATGALGGVISFFFPVLSEIYWAYGAWKFDGFNTPYIQWLILFFVMWVCKFIFSYVLVTVEDKFSKNINY
ncbi:hypothetical protein V7128_01850 [Neobacillus vireti]|uniref:hypothetical protein n=1 Tax=Neobacillus vireti TaxID=220686 RepID=UPI003000F61A